jgi:hypothetical protein
MTTATELIAVTVREWTDILARIRFGTVSIAGKTYSAARIKLVAHRLANYADSDGTRIHPGIARLAVDLEIEYRTVRDSLALLRRLGLVQIVRPAAGRGRADEYRLTLPTDLLDRDDLEVWTPTHHAQHTQKVRAAHRGTSRTPSNVLCTRGPADPTPAPADTGAHAPQDPATLPEPPAAAASSGTTKSGAAGSSRTAAQSPHAPTTYQDHHTTPTDQSQDVTVTVTPACGPPRPTRCEHGLTAALRLDGEPACALCRVIGRRTPITATAADRRQTSHRRPHRPAPTAPVRVPILGKTASDRRSVLIQRLSVASNDGLATLPTRSGAQALRPWTAHPSVAGPRWATRSDTDVLGNGLRVLSTDVDTGAEVLRNVRTSG